MTTIKDLELALQIAKAEEAGEPLEWECNFVEGWKPPLRGPLWYLVHGGKIRLKPKPTYVDLGPEDVPPGSVIRHAGAPDSWWQVLRVHENYIVIAPTAFTSELSYGFLRHNDREINRSLSTGAWDPTAWQPCRKEKV